VVRDPFKLVCASLVAGVTHAAIDKSLQSFCLSVYRLIVKVSSNPIRIRREGWNRSVVRALTLPKMNSGRFYSVSIGGS